MKARFLLIALFLVMLSSSKFLQRAHLQGSTSVESPTTTPLASTTTDNAANNSDSITYYEALMQR